MEYHSDGKGIMCLHTERQEVRETLSSLDHYEMVDYLNTCSSTSRADQEQLFEVVRLPDGKPKAEFIIPWEEINKV